MRTCGGGLLQLLQLIQSAKARVKQPAAGNQEPVTSNQQLAVEGVLEVLQVEDYIPTAWPRGLARLMANHLDDPWRVMMPRATGANRATRLRMKGEGSCGGTATQWLKGCLPTDADASASCT